MTNRVDCGTEAVDEFFRSLECATTLDSPHDGEIAGWAEAHGCASGWLCAGHIKNFIEVVRPRNAERLKTRGALACPLCNGVFDDPDEFAGVWVL
jgi:hypothetical protein